MITTLAPFLAFTGHAKEAVAFYAAVFPGAQVAEEIPFGPGEEGAEGTLRFAAVRIGASVLRIIDVPDEDYFAINGGVSVFVTCTEAEDIDILATALRADQGQALMPPDAYPFADRYAWVTDPFGVNWQLMYGDRMLPAGQEA